MKKLGEQWVEVIDGQEHMVKVVKGRKICEGCLYNGNGGNCEREEVGNACSSFIIKDLGILRDGFLPEERTGFYPDIINDTGRMYTALVHDTQKMHEHSVIVRAFSIEALKDAWNRRA